MSNVPRFQDPFLEDIAFAFRKRRKAMKYLANGASYAKVYEVVDGTRIERLEIELSQLRDITLRLHAWPDRLIWLHMQCHPKKGRLWEWTYEGRLLGDIAASKVIEALDVTRLKSWGMDASRIGEYTEPWARLLAQGPRLVG